MELKLTDTSLVDVLMVAGALPVEEIKQIEAFTGQPFDAESTALRVFGSPGHRWTLRVAESNEPVAVIGIIPVGGATWRTYMLVPELAWTQHGKQITKQTVKLMNEVVGTFEHIRLETLCLATRRKACEWYERIGLKLEATLRGYGADGESAVLYVNVKGARNY